MKKFLDSHVPFIISIIFVVMVNVIFWPVYATTVKDDANVTFWMGYAFIMISMSVMVCLTLIRLKHMSALTSLLAVFYGAGIYLLLAVVLNIIFMVVNTNDWILCFVLNILLILGFSVALILAYVMYSRVEEKTEKRETQVKNFRTVAVKINALTYSSKDEEVTAAINDLYKYFNSGSSYSTPQTADIEAAFEEQIAVIKDLLESNNDKEQVLKAIEKAKQMLLERNQLLLVR